MCEERFNDWTIALRVRSPWLFIAAIWLSLFARPASAQRPIEPDRESEPCESLCDPTWTCCRDPEFVSLWRQGCAALQFRDCPARQRDAVLAADVLAAGSGDDGPCDFDTVWGQWMAERTPCSASFDEESTARRFGSVAWLRCTTTAAWRFGSERHTLATAPWRVRETRTGSWAVVVQLFVAAGTR